ncbi:MAG: hypothetical protein KF774_13270 [Planctomyces sp.]|nr:hypothetical protein [Planctomyces sp.]
MFVPTDEEFDDDEGDEESGLLTIRVEFPPNLRGVVEASLNGLLARAPGVRVHGPQGG